MFYVKFWEKKEKEKAIAFCSLFKEQQSVFFEKMRVMITIWKREKMKMPSIYQQNSKVCNCLRH